MASELTRFACCLCSVVIRQKDVPLHWKKTTDGKWGCKRCAGTRKHTHRFLPAFTKTDDTVGILYDWNGLRFGNDVYYPPRLDVLPGWVRFRYWSS